MSSLDPANDVISKKCDSEIQYIWGMGFALKKRKSA